MTEGFIEDHKTFGNNSYMGVFRVIRFENWINEQQKYYMRRSNVQSQKDVVGELVRRIVEAVHPLRIILFGSAARGEVGPNSDIDVLVVMPEGVHRRQIAQLLYNQISGLGIPFDILVATPKDLEKHKENIGLIYRSVLREGREVYAA